MKKSVFLFFLILSIPSLAALDLNPPDWRGQERTTSQYWDFSSPSLSPFPDDYDNPFGPLAAEVQPSRSSWCSVYKEHEGVFPLSGHIFIPILNFEEELNEKKIWVQLTWISKGCIPNVEATAGTQGENANWVEGILLENEPLECGWMHSTYEIVLYPNPTQETIHISGRICVDDVVIDTICFPEPAALGLLALGSVFVRNSGTRSF